MPDFIFSSVFGDLTRQVQLRFDAISKLNKQLFDNVIFTNYMTWDIPTIDLSFEEIKGLYNITIAAATIGDNSKEPIIGYEAPEIMAQKVLHHAITRSMTTQNYRKVLALKDSTRLDDQTKRNELIDLMFGEVQNVVDGVLARLDIIFLSALSNEGVCTLDADNNPEGGVKTIIDYGMPDDNKFTSKLPWTSDNSETIDILADIQQVVDAAQDKVVFDKIICDPKQRSYILQTAAVKRAIWGSDKSATPVTPDMLNTFLEANDLPKIEVVRRHVRIMDNGKLRPLKPWNANNMVFVPAGNLGIVKNAYADNELKQEPGVTYSNYGRIRVSQWGAGETTNSNGVEFTKAQVYALPVLTEIDGIYSLNTQAGIQTTSLKTAEGVNPLNVSAGEGTTADEGTGGDDTSKEDKKKK